MAQKKNQISKTTTQNSDFNQLKPYTFREF
jgi:hypothetical protein